MKTLIISALAITGVAYSFLNAPQKNILIKGYDPVTYFDGNPQKGSAEYQYKYKEQTIWFVDELNKGKFKASPQKYYPKYGGWCAYAMGKDGSKVGINPKTYEIREDGLYLFYNKLGTNTLKLWNEEGAEILKKKADVNWQNTKDKSGND